MSRARSRAGRSPSLVLRTVHEAELVEPTERRNVYEAELLDLEEREVIRHPDIYRTQRTSVPFAPAARTRPTHLDGEPTTLALPGDERIGWLGVLSMVALLAGVAAYLLQ